jgi:hypothetical protein
MSDKVELVAAAQVNALLSPPTIEFNSNYGFQTAVRSSAGVYVLELEHKHGVKKQVVNVTLSGTSAGEVVASVLDETHIQVSTFNIEGTATDSPFFITVNRVRD